jgi:hypothetical protein
MPNRIIFTSKTKVGIEAGKIPTSVDVLVQTDNSPNMDDFRNWASDTNALISLNRTLQNEGIGNTSSGAQYFNRYGSANLYQTKLIPTTDYAGRTVAAQGDNRSWIRKDYIENYKVTAKGALNKSKTIFTVNLSGVQQTEKLYTILVPTAGGLATEPPQSNVLGNPPQLPGIFDGSITRKLTTSTGNTTGLNSITVTSIYGSSVASYGIYPGSSISGTGIPDGTYVASTYTTGSTTIPLVDIDGNTVTLTADCQNEILYIEIPDNIIPPGVPHYNTPTNGSGATFAVYYNEDSIIEEIIVVNPGDNYSASNQSTVNKLIIPGSLVGGDDGDNDITLTSYNLNTYALLITDTDFQEKNVNLQDTINSEETGIDTFTYSGTAAGTVTKSATMVKDQTFITVTNASLIVKGMKVTSSTGFGIPQNTYVGDSYVSGSTTVPLTTSNGITPVKVTLTYTTGINVSFEYAATFTNVTGTNITGSGSGATFIITKNINNTYNVFLTSSGSNYTSGTQIRILGSQIGGVNSTNDLIITVQKVLDKFPPNTRVSFFERSKTNPGYYELYLSSLPRTGVSYSKTSTLTGNTSGNNYIDITNGSSIAAGQQIAGTNLNTSAANNISYVANSFVSNNTQGVGGSCRVPLTEADGTTEVTLTADANNLSLTFSSPVVIENGDGLVFYRSYNSFWSQLNSGSIFEGRPTNYIAWYRATKLQTRNIPVTLLPPNDSNNKYKLYNQRFRVDSSVNLKTAVTLGSDWSLYIQVGKNPDPKWETSIIISIDTKSTYVLNGKTRYIFEIITQYPSKYSWDLSTEEISYCYIYKNILGGIFSDYITQTVPYNKAYVTSEYVWKAPTTVSIPVTNTVTTTEGGIFKLNSISDTITGSTPVFRVADKDTYSMFIRTWRDILPQTYSGTLTSNQIKLISTASNPRYIFLNPRSIQFRSVMNNNTYLNVDTGNLNLGTTPETNPNINYTTNVIRLDTFPTYAPTNPGIWTYSFGRQYLYFQNYAWNFYSDNLTSSTFTGNPTSLSSPYKFISTVPYYQGVTVTARGSSTPILVTLDAHGLQAGDAILFDQSLYGISSGSINSRGIRSGTTYFVSPNNLTENTFEIVTTKTGTISLTSSSGSLAAPAVSTPGMYVALQTVNTTISSSQTSGIQLSGLHGLVIRGVYKIQAGTTEPIQLQDQYYYFKREFPNRESVDGEPKTITAISRSAGSTTVTVTTSTAHGMSVNDFVVITTTDSSLNTTESSPAVVTQVVNSTQFRYTTAGLTTAVSLSAGTAQPRAGWKRYIKINNEILSFDYYTVDGNNRFTLYGVVRGELGTTAQTHSSGSDISIALDTWSSSGVRVSNNLFNTNGTLKSNVNLTYQNNWTYTREFPDYGGSNGLMYHGVGRRDAFQPSRWEVALFGPGYFAPGTLSFVSVPSTTDTTRTSGRYTTVSGTANAIGTGAQFTITIGLTTTKTAASYTSGTNQIVLDDATSVVAGQKIQSSASGIPSNTTVTNVSGNTITLSANLTSSQTSTTTLYFFDATDRTVIASVTNGGSQYKIGETITIPASSIGGTGSSLVLTATYLNFGTLYDGMDYAQPGIGKKLNKNPYYQALYKESSEVKYYQEPAEIGQRSYEDLFGAFSQAMVKTKNIISGIPDDTTPYYNVRSSSDAILLQASRDQYFSYLSGLIKRPKYLTTATTINSNVLQINDAIGIEVGDTVYGPGIDTDGAIVKSITGPSYFTLSYRNGVIKLGDGTYKKTSGSWSWNSDAYSITGYTTNVVASARAGETTSYIMFGLNSDPLTNSSYTSIDYAWYPAGNGRLYIYENGGYIGDYGVYYTTTNLKIEYNGSQVIYYKDGVAQRTVNRSIGNPLYFDSSFVNVGASLKNVFFGEIGTTTSGREATIQLRQKRTIIKNIDVVSYIYNNFAQGGYEYPVNDAALGIVARISIPNSYGISQTLVPDIVNGPFKYYISEIKFEYVDPIYQSQFKTFFFEEDKYSCPILKTEIDNNSGNLFLYIKNPTALTDATKEKYDSKLYSLKSKIDIVVFEDYKLNPEVTRVGVTLSTSTKEVNVISVTGIKQGMTVTTFNPGGFTNYTGTLPANTTVQSIVNDTTILLNNFPTASGLASLKFVNNSIYPIGTQYIFDPSPNLNKNNRYILDSARPSYFTSKWIPNQTELDLYFSPDINDPSNSINYPFNLNDEVKYYAVDSADKFVYKISTITLNSGSSYLSRSTTDTSFANLAVGQKIYFTNIPAGVSLSENTPYYITYVLNNDLRISTTSGGSPIDISSGVTLSNLNLRMRRVYDTGFYRNTLRTSLTYFDYQVQTSISEVPSGDVFAVNVATNGGTLNNGQITGQSFSGTALTTYSGLSVSNISGSGSGATFNVSKSGTTYTPTKVNSGDNYQVGNQFNILGTSLGGATPANDLTFTVSTISNSTYTALSGTNISGSGSGATFNVTRSGTTYTPTVNAAGSGYAVNNQIRILGTAFAGGATTTNDLTITVASVTTVNYTALSGTNVSGTGTGATFNIARSGTTYTPTVNAAGSGYAVGNQIRILGTSLGGATTANDLTITVATVTPVTYTGLSGTNVSGTGTGATFNVSRSGTAYTVTVNAAGSGYAATNQIRILGTSLGGATPANDLTITVNTTSSGSLTTAGNSYSGTAIASNPIATITSSGTAFGTAISTITSSGTAVAAGPLNTFTSSGTALTSYTGLTGTVTGGGSGGTYTVTVSGTTYTISRTADGSNYTTSSSIKILGTSLGGSTPANDLTITISSVSTGGSNLLLTSGNSVQAGMYVVSNISGIPALTVVGSSYVSGSSTVPLRDTSGNPVSLTANMSGQQVIFTKAAVRVYSYDNTAFNTYPYIGVAYRPSATGYPVESNGVNTQIPSVAFQDQLQFTFANDTLPQEIYPYAKIEVKWPSLTLAQNITVNDTIIKVNEIIPEGYPEFGNVKIGTERIYYGYRTNTYFGDCVIKFPHAASDTITHSPNYSIKVDGLLQNGCSQNNQTKLIVMAPTPGSSTGYSPSASAQTVYVAGFEMDQDSTNTISFPSTAKYTVISDKINSSIEVTVSRTGNSITLPANAIKTGQTLNDGDEIILLTSFGLGSGYKIVQQLSSSKILLNKPTLSDTRNTSGVAEYRRLFSTDSDIISGMNDTFIDTALNFNAKKGLKYVGLSGCTDFKPVKCTKIKYATATANKYSNTITLADDIAASTYTLSGLSAYFSSGSTKASNVKSVLFFDGEDYEIKSINTTTRVVTLVQPLKQKIRFRDAVTIKSDGYIPEFERVPNVKGLVYGPQKAVFYDRYRAAQVSAASLGYNSTVNRFRWRLTFTRGVPSGLALNDKVSTNLNYNDYFITCLPSSSELGTTTSSSQIIVSSSSNILPDRNGSNQNVNQNIVYFSKPNGYVARDFESASMQIGGYKNSSRQQIIPTQVLAEATDGAIADIEAVSTRATRDIFTSSLGEVMGRFLFKQKNFASSNRPNLWRNEITPPTGMNVKTGKLLSYTVNNVPNYITFQSATNSKLFYGDSSTWSTFTATSITINDIGLDTTNSRLLFACSSNTIRYSSYSTPTTFSTTTISGSGTNTYITYVGGYYFVGNSTGGLYYSTSVAGTFYSITTGNTSPILGVYYDEFKFVITHERISGSGTVYKNYTVETLTGAAMNINTASDKIKGLTNLFSPKKTISSVSGFGKILEAGYSLFDGVSTYSSPVTEVYEYENFSDYTADDISDDFETKGLSFNFGQFAAFGKQTSTNKQFVKYSSNARLWDTVEFENLISLNDEITGFVYGGFNNYVAIVWDSTTSTNKILTSNVKSLSDTATFTVSTNSSGSVTGISAISSAGTGYFVGDTITLESPGIPNNKVILTVSAVNASRGITSFTHPQISSGSPVSSGTFSSPQGSGYTASQTNVTAKSSVDTSQTSRYRKIEESESIKLYKYKTITTSQEGNLLIWNSGTSKLIWLKNLFGSPLKSNEFTDYKSLAAENFVVYTKNLKLLPNFRSINDADGASRAVSIYNERLPLGSATIATSGNGYQYGTYTGVEILNGSTSEYGNNRATATVGVDDTGKVISVKVDTSGDYYPSNTSLLLVNDTGILEGSGGSVKLNSSRTVNKLNITFTTTSQTSYTKTATWSANSTTVTLSNLTGITIVPGQEITGSGIPTGTYVGSSYSSGTSIPLVNASGSLVTLLSASSGSPTLTFKLNFITIPAGQDVSGLVRGMTVTGGTLQTGTVILNNYFASENVGPVDIPISKAPSSNFTLQTLSFSISGTQASITTSQTALDASTFSLNGFNDGESGYCVLYRNTLNGIDFIALFFNSSGILVDCITTLKSSDIIHLSRTEMFAQAL